MTDIKFDISYLEDLKEQFEEGVKAVQEMIELANKLNSSKDRSGQHFIEWTEKHNLSNDDVEELFEIIYGAV